MASRRPETMQQAAKWIKASEQYNAQLKALSLSCAMLALDLKIESVTVQSERSDLTQCADATIDAVMEINHWLNHMQDVLQGISGLIPEGDALQVLPNSLGESTGLMLSEARMSIARLLRLMPKLGWGLSDVVSAGDGQDMELMLRQNLDLLLSALDVLILELPKLNKA